MAIFSFHFFKEKTRKLNIEAVIDFFEQQEGYVVTANEDTLRFDYEFAGHYNKISYIFLPKSIVPNIQRINPKFIDLNFHVEMPILMSDYVFKQALEVIRKFCYKFETFVFSEMLQDVMPFKEDALISVFQIIKKTYIERNPALLLDFVILNRNESDVYYKYMDSLLELHHYFTDINVYVPHLLFLKNKKGEFKTAIEWKDRSNTVFPAKLDYVLYKVNETYKVFQYRDIKKLLSKYLLDVPGFTVGTYYTNPKYYKKISKLINKAKLETVENTFTKVHLKHIID